MFPFISYVSIKNAKVKLVLNVCKSQPINFTRPRHVRFLFLLLWRARSLHPFFSYLSIHLSISLSNFSVLVLVCMCWVDWTFSLARLSSELFFIRCWFWISKQRNIRKKTLWWLTQLAGLLRREKTPSLVVDSFKKIRQVNLIVRKISNKEKNVCVCGGGCLLALIWRAQEYQRECKSSHLRIDAEEDVEGSAMGHYVNPSETFSTAKKALWSSAIAVQWE